MKKTTIKAVAQATGTDARLIRAVAKQLGGLENLCTDYRDILRSGATAGYCGFIYYTDTEAFTRKNRARILESVQNLAHELGENMLQFIASFNCLNLSETEIFEALSNHKSEHRTELYNALAWYALEEVARAFEQYHEED